MISPGARWKTAPCRVRQAMPIRSRTVAVRTCFPGQWWLMMAIKTRTQMADVFSKKAAVEEGIVVKLMSSQAMQAKRKVPKRPAAFHT